VLFSLLSLPSLQPASCKQLAGSNAVFCWQGTPYPELVEGYGRPSRSASCEGRLPFVGWEADSRRRTR